jgi:hypothetical protein
MEREPNEIEVASLDLGNPRIGPTRSRNWSVALVALACSLIGAGAVLATMRLAPQWFSPAPLQTAHIETPAINPPPAGQQLYVEPKDPFVPETPKDPAKPAAEPGKPENAPTTHPAAGTAPLNPFSGAIISRTPMPDGWAPGASDAPPKVAAEPRPEAAPKSRDSVLVTIRESSSDPESQAAEIGSALRTAGASVRTATHYNAAGSPVGVQIIATLPASSLDRVLAKVGSGDRWTGEPAARAREVDGIFSSRLRNLRIKEVELREKYEDDATELVVVREEIQKLTQGMAMARGAKSPGIAVILVGIGDL